MDQNNESVITTIAALFAVVAIGFGLSFGGTQLINSAAEKAGEKSSDVAEQSMAQTAAAAGCPTYATSIGGSCVRSGSTTYTVVLVASGTPTVDAIDDSYTVEENNTLKADDFGNTTPNPLLANDSPDPVSLTVSNWNTSGMTGSLSGKGDTYGSFEYNAPSVSATTTKTFNYTATDGTDSDTATAAIEIQPSGSNPSTVDAVDDSYTVEENDTLTVDSGGTTPDPVLKDDSPDPASLTVSNWNTSGLNGSLSGTGSAYGSFDFSAPPVSATTTTTFNYKATDGTDSDTATAAIQITPKSTNVTLTADGSDGSTTIDEGEDVTLDWNTTNVNTCNWLSGKGVSGSANEDGGQEVVTLTPSNPPKTYTYEMQCVNGGDQVTDDVKVTVQKIQPEFNFEPKQQSIWIVADEPSATSTEATLTITPTGAPGINADDVGVTVDSSNSDIDSQYVDITRFGSGNKKVGVTVREDNSGLQAGTYQVVLKAEVSTPSDSHTEYVTTSVRAQTTAEF
jgi:hypothetical protein